MSATTRRRIRFVIAFTTVASLVFEPLAASAASPSSADPTTTSSAAQPPEDGGFDQDGEVVPPPVRLDLDGSRLAPSVERCSSDSVSRMRPPCRVRWGHRPRCHSRRFHRVLSSGAHTRHHRLATTVGRALKRCVAQIKFWRPSVRSTGLQRSRLLPTHPSEQSNSRS